MVPENGNGDPIHVGADCVTLRGRGRFSASAGILQQDSPYFNLSLVAFPLLLLSVKAHQSSLVVT
jgi:hypothetical protein